MRTTLLGRPLAVVRGVKSVLPSFAVVLSAIVAGCWCQSLRRRRSGPEVAPYSLVVLVSVAPLEDAGNRSVPLRRWRPGRQRIIFPFPVKAGTAAIRAWRKRRIPRRSRRF